MVVFMTSLYQKLNNLIDLNRLQKFCERVSHYWEVIMKMLHSLWSFDLVFGVPQAIYHVLLKQLSWLIFIQTRWKLCDMRTAYRPHSTLIKSQIKTKYKIHGKYTIIFLFGYVRSSRSHNVMTVRHKLLWRTLRD